MKATLLLPALALVFASCAAPGATSTREVVQVAQASGGA